MNDILRPPCVFCGYKGNGYWNIYEHDKDCPWYQIGGHEERAEKLREVLTKLHAEAIQ